MTDTAVPISTLKRDSFVTGLIGSAHFISHFYQLSLAPLFPVFHTYFGVSYTALGSLVTAFYLVSGLCQAFAGIFVDKWGPRPVLLFGMMSMATCIGLAGLVTHFWMFYPLLVLAGTGNSVFHPADFSALSHQVSKPRLGRAFSIHACGGRLGYAMAPLIVGTLATYCGWRMALGTAGIFGWLVSLALIRYGRDYIPDHGFGDAANPHASISYSKLIAMPALLFAFGYFFLTAAAGSAFQNFSIAAFMDYYGVSLDMAARALSAYLISSAVGMLCGGVLADHTQHHARVAALGLCLTAAFMALIASGNLSYGLVVAAAAAVGACEGVTAPSRDILVKGAAPPGATGRVFGFVYSGLDAGSTVAPLVFGALVDHHAYHAIFFGIAILFGSAILSVLTLGQRQTAKQA